MRKTKLLFLLAVSAVLLAGCGEVNQPISAESTGLWNQYLVWPLVSVIMYFKELLGTYGFAIIAVTILVRIAILPLVLQQAKSAKAMQALKPELDRLKKQYASKDAVTKQKYNEEMMALYKERSINPAAGCLPLVIQMPVIIALYHAINRMHATPSIELGSLLGLFDLAQPSIALAAVAAIMQFLVMKAGPSMQNDQMPGMGMMVYFMPVMIFFFAIALPSALALYWVVANTISLMQNLLLYKPWRPKAPVAAVQAAGPRKAGRKK